MKLAFFIHYLFINDPGIGRTVTKTRYVTNGTHKNAENDLKHIYIVKGSPE